MASCLAHLGRLNEAQEIVKRLRAITPVVIPTAEHWRGREDREYYFDGLRFAAGITPDEGARQERGSPDDWFVARRPVIGAEATALDGADIAGSWQYENADVLRRRRMAFSIVRCSFLLTRGSPLGT